MKEFGDVEIEGFKRTGGKKKYKTRKLSKIEKDGSKTIVYTLEINGENKIHNWDGPALINKEKKIKEYYLHGFQCTLDDWKEMKRERAGLPWYKNPSLKGTARL